MSLDLYLTRVQETCVFDANITHNLTKMADAVGIYECLWRPKEGALAGEMIESLEKAIALLHKHPDIYDKMSASNGWGTREQFIPWLEKVLVACQEYPDAKVSASV